MRQQLIAALMITAFTSIGAWAQEASPVGLWKNIDQIGRRMQAVARPDNPFNGP